MSTFNKIAVCPDCDLVVHHSELEPSQSASCSRCGALVAQKKEWFIQKTMAYSLAGLLFYFPAVLLPLITLNILGESTTNTMLRGIIMLGHQGFWWLSFLVLMCSVVVPLLNLTMLFTVSLGLHRGWMGNPFKRVILWQKTLSEWAMLEVYMLGLLVAYTKLVDMGGIVIGFGFYCYIGMLLAGMLAQSVYSAEQAFEHMDELKRQGLKHEP